MATIFDFHPKEKIEKTISQINKMLDDGIDRNAILEQLEMEELDEIYEIALARRSAKTKSIPGNLYFNMDDLRFATNQKVADYRAKRLKCDKIADLGCSAGIQALAFAKTCKKVYAVEIDERKLRYAIENAKILGIHNIEFVLGDALDDKTISKIKDADVFFCDPSRLPEETERRLDTISPNPNIILKKYPQNIAMEFPPQIAKIDFDCEKEYISLGGHLNRLTLYFGDLKKADVSVVSLPSEKKMEYDGTREFFTDSKKGLPMEYLYEVDSAVVKAGMFWQLAKITDAIPIEEGILTSDRLIKNDFFRNTFKVLDAVHHDFESIVHALEKNEIGKVVIRYRILPQDYWTERTRYEKHLKGKKTAHLFIFEKAVIAEKV